MPNEQALIWPAATQTLMLTIDTVGPFRNCERGVLASEAKGARRVHKKKRSASPLSVNVFLRKQQFTIKRLKRRSYSTVNDSVQD